MAESDFQTELGRGFDGLAGCHWHKIADMPHFLAKQAKVTLKKPYDCYALHFGLFCGIELKQPNGMSLRTQSPNSSGLSVEQEACLLAVEQSGGVGLVVANFLVALSPKESKARAGLAVYDRSWATTMSQLKAARKECAADAIPLKWWEANAVELPACKVDGRAAWDPRPMLTMAREWRLATPWGA